jgi:hypothetical protein
VPFSTLSENIKIFFFTNVRTVGIMYSQTKEQQIVMMETGSFGKQAAESRRKV